MFLAISLPLELALGLAIALYLHGSVLPNVRNVVRVVLVIPMAMTPVVVGLIGSLVLNNQFGLVNYMLLAGSACRRSTGSATPSWPLWRR